LIALALSSSSPFILFIPVVKTAKDDVEALEQLAPKHPTFFRRG